MFEGESRVESLVKGVHIVLDERRLGHLLEVPRSGICYLNLTDKVEALKCVLERDNANEIEQLVANQLSVEMRLLHSIVGYIIFFKIGGHDWVGKRELALCFI